MPEEVYNEPAYSKNVLEFIRVALEYCLFIEKNDGSKEEMLIFFQRLGPLLYLKGALLPDVAVENPEANERFVTQEEYENIFNNLRTKFLPEDEYLFMDYETGVAGEPLKASLAECLSDIYQDLKDFMILYQKNSRDAKQNAVKECKSLFDSNWGPKMLASLNFVHYLLNRGKPKGNINPTEE